MHSFVSQNADVDLKSEVMASWLKVSKLSCSLLQCTQRKMSFFYQKECLTECHTCCVDTGGNVRGLGRLSRDHQSILMGQLRRGGLWLELELAETLHVRPHLGNHSAQNTVLLLQTTDLF